MLATQGVSPRWGLRIFTACLPGAHAPGYLLSPLWGKLDLLFTCGLRLQPQTFLPKGNLLRDLSRRRRAFAAKRQDRLVNAQDSVH